MNGFPEVKVSPLPWWLAFLMGTCDVCGARPGHHRARCPEIPTLYQGTSSAPASQVEPLGFGRVSRSVDGHASE
jgi:hypothetical protein